MATKIKKTEETTVSTRKKIEGVVVSTKMKDTVVVKVSRFVKHPKYGKYTSKDKKFKAHDAGNTKKVGDKVVIEECAPISKDKHFRIV
ncbi:MAG: 30S ribosomal protein S17 [Nitrospira sp.]